MARTLLALLFVSVLLGGCLGGSPAADSKADPGAPAPVGPSDSIAGAPDAVGDPPEGSVVVDGPAAEGAVPEGYRQLPAVEVITHDLYLDLSLASSDPGPQGFTYGDSMNRAIQTLQNASWIQGELLWNAEGAAAQRMWFYVRSDEAGPEPDYMKEVRGPSALVLDVNGDDVDGSRFVSFFVNVDRQGDMPVGAVLQQDLTLYVTVFRGFEPPAGWRYSEHGLPPVPPDAEPAYVPAATHAPVTLEQELFIQESHSLAGQGAIVSVGTGENNADFDLPFGVTGLQVELAWTPSQPTSENLRLSAQTQLPPPQSFSSPNTIGHATATGPSTLVIWIGPDLLVGAGVLGLTVSAWDSAGAPVGLAVQQAATAYVTFFYGSEPPVGWLFSVDGPLALAS